MSTLPLRLLTTLLIISVGASSPAIAQTASTRSYAIPGHGMLELVVPASWKDSISQPPRGLPPTITFSPPTGDDFQVLVTALWHPQGDPGFNSLQNIRALLERQGQKLLAQAVEKTLVLEELKGKEASGLHYSLTDRAPKPGEYEYMTQGAVGVDELMLMFTILFRRKDAPERQAALEVLETASRKLPRGN